MTLIDFLSMGRYDVYVWSSYAITLVVLVLNIIQPKMREQKVKRELQKRLYSEHDNSEKNK